MLGGLCPSVTLALDIPTIIPSSLLKYHSPDSLTHCLLTRILVAYTSYLSLLILLHTTRTSTRRRRICTLAYLE